MAKLCVALDTNLPQALELVKSLRGYPLIFKIGVHALDTPYPDCRVEFITAMESAINSASAYVAKTKRRISLYAPFLGMSKTDIARLGKELGVPFEKTYSCYMGTEPSCGVCATCLQRQEALRSIGLM